MRVLHVIPAVASRYGGPSIAIWPMVRSLREFCGIDVEVATTDADGPSGRLREADLPDCGATVHLFDRGRGENRMPSRSLDRWLRFHARDYDLVQVHSHWNGPAAAACRRARGAGVPYLIRPCGMLSDFTWRSSRWKKRAYWWWRERRNVRDAAAFHVTSDGERADVLRLGVTAPVETIPLGIDREAWEAPVEPQWLRQRCPQAGDRPLVVFLSRLHPKKGLTDFLLPAFARLKSDAFLAVVGEEDSRVPGYAGLVEREVRRLRLEGKVALLGPVRPERRWAAFDGADLFVLPSHSENFGIVVAEAMARARPVVITRGVQFAEHVEQAGAGAVIGPSIETLAAALDEWLGDPSRRERAGERGRRYIQSHLSWRQTAAGLADLYRRIGESGKRNDVADRRLAGRI